MNKTTDWASKMTFGNLHAVPAVRNLKPNSDQDYIQYFDEVGQETALLRSARPYGILTPQAFTEDSEGLHLLHAREKDKDWVAFDIPEETIGLKAATLGTGWRHADLLVPTYENVGRVVTQVGEIATPPALGLESFALRRETGEIVFVPPVEFAPKTSVKNIGDVINDLANTVQQELSHIFNPTIRQMLGQAVLRGYEG